MKKIFLALLFIFFLAPFSVHAEGVSPKCFTHDMCDQQGGDFCDKGSDTNCSQCPGALSMCYSKTTPITLNVLIGDKGSVKDFGEYIALAYQYFIGVGAILAIVLMMVGGIQWIISAGDSGAVGTAKKRVTHAVTGLALLIFSYVILNTINPDLVRLHPPRIAMVRKEVFAEDTNCATYGNDALLAEKKTDDQKYESVGKNDFAKASEIKGEQSTGPQCGKNYFVKDASGITCQGSVCRTGFQCGQGACKETGLTGHATISGDYKINQVKLMLICANGFAVNVYTAGKAAGTSFDYEIPHSVIDDINKAQATCKDNAGTRGLAFVFSINKGLIWDSWYGFGISLKDLAKNNSCVFNKELGPLINGFAKDPGDFIETSKKCNHWYDCNDGGYWTRNKGAATSNDTASDFSDGGYSCDYKLCESLLPPSAVALGKVSRCDINIDGTSLTSWH